MSDNESVGFEWTDEKIQTMLEQVKLLPLIWNQNLKEYRDRTRKDAAFTQIGDILGNNLFIYLKLLNWFRLINQIKWILYILYRMFGY